MLTTTTTTLATGTVTTWVGTTRVSASAQGVRQICLPDWHAPEAASWQMQDMPITIAITDEGEPQAAEHLRQALAELGEYFSGQRRAFTVALDLQGTEFFRAVWAEVARVPYGATRSYLAIAQALGKPAATRAVGAANGANPVAPIVPCHRIIGSNGKLTGYGPGLPLKARLLAMEAAG